ncbi:MAG: cellulase family glycosylhydrolase [Actinomycetota bacterium]|nr:cellulase family glycosylhydrolase [Actinomycetota bacterium]
MAAGLALRAAVACARPAGAAPTPPLSATGRWITDAQGRVVITHGVNVVNKPAPYSPAAAGFGEDDARFLAEQGFTSVRLGFAWSAVEPQPGRYDDAYVAQIRATQEILARHGIYSVIDSHQDLFNRQVASAAWDGSRAGRCC